MCTILGLGWLPLRAYNHSGTNASHHDLKEFRLNEMSDCSRIKSWEKAAKKKGTGYMYTRPKGNVNSMLTNLNCTGFCFQVKYSSDMQTYLKRAPVILCCSRNYKLCFLYMTKCSSYKMPFLLMSAKYYQDLQD